MGCFGYKCRGCGTAIIGDCFKGGEKCIMIHVRNGQELGRVEGHYNEYGRVIEQEGLSEEEKFRGNSDNINGHSEICDSEFFLDDSYCKVMEKKQYKGRDLDFYFYVNAIIHEEMLTHIQDITKSRLYKYVEDEYKEDIEKAYVEGKFHKATTFFSIGLELLKYDKKTKIYKEFLKLPQATREKYSGIVAWHSACYNKATEEEKNNLTPSEADPNQSWGKVRKKYS